MKKLAQGAIATGAGTLAYTVPSGFRTAVTDIDICNTTSGALTLALHLVPVGGSAATTNMLCPTITINAYSMFQWSGKQVLNTGDFIRAIGSGTGLTMNISGEENRVGM